MPFINDIYHYNVKELRKIESSFFVSYWNFPCNHHAWREVAERRADFQMAAKATGCWELFINARNHKRRGKPWQELGEKRIKRMKRWLDGKR